ncbi:MAG: glycosyltransferase family 4 protein [Anaerolineae bacterium]|nr:glycosyltransferase family 4 protein [Anaerolineae bacterium]
MRIAIDASRTTVKQRTGTEAYSLHLIRALINLNTQHHLTLYFRDVPDPALFPAAGATRRIRGMIDHAPAAAGVWTVESERWTLTALPFPRLWTHLRFARALFADRPDVTFVPAHTLPFVFPGPGVATVHDLGHRYFPEAHTAASRLYIDLTTRYSARRARCVLADSAATRRDLMAFYGVPGEKIRVVYPGVDPNLKPVHDAEALEAVRAQYDIPGPYLLYLGSIQPRKNLSRLVEAYAAWRSEAGAKYYLVLGGKKGWLYEDIFAAVRRLGLEEWVRFPGYIDGAHVAALYSGAVAFLFPSRHEGFGFPVLEAMRCETPVVCSNTSSLPEAAGDAALMVDPESVADIAAAIARITGDAELRARLVEAGKAQAARFTWEAAARQTMAALEAAAQPGKKPGS